MSISLPPFYRLPVDVLRMEEIDREIAAALYAGDAYFHDLTFLPDQDDVDAAIDVSFQEDTADTQSMSPTEPYLVGFVIANIVGLQYYNGNINGREAVALVREPLNCHDPNAIKVLNTRTFQVGHIERTVAAVLAPLIDNHMITVEGIVPKDRGGGNKFKIPCQVHIFARPHVFEAVKRTISRGGLVLISGSDAGFSLSEAVVVKERTKGEEVRSIDEIFKLVDQNVREKTRMQAVEPSKEVIKSPLFQHQKEGLGWLLHRENSGDLPPFWEEKDGCFKNVLTNYATDKRPEPLRGGIFADDMGLGKTLTLLSLIAFDKLDSGSASRDGNDSGSVIVDARKFDENCENSEIVPTNGNKRARVMNSSRPLKKRRVDGSKSTSNVQRKRRTTLIVCPPSVISTWITQLEEHTVRGSLKMYLYYGSERTSNERELCKYDIVLTTYSILSNETWRQSPIARIQWWRVILDEAHAIKNVKAQQSQAVTNLEAKRRWVVTGTPIQNGSFDLFSLMAFLHFEPFSIKSYWQSLIQRQLSEGKKTGLSRLQVLMATISLRRTKDKALIKLPQKTIETYFVDLSCEERAFYDQMEREAKNVVRVCMQEGSLMRNYSTVLSIILRLRQICLSLDLCPPELKSVLPSDNIEDVSNNPDLLKKVLLVLQDGEDFDCPICISPPNDIVITCCAHIFCRPCILKTLRTAKSNCPLCRRPLSESDLYSAPPESVNSSNSEPSSSKPNHLSTKISVLLKLLKASTDRKPDGKSVVYSQFRKLLILLEEPLKAAGFETLRLDGSMNAKKRAQVIQEFGAMSGPTILLASLRASGTGINLTAASTVYLMEPWWNPAVEEQAMDRVHRIGQKEDVRIVKVIARNSIEERVLKLQEKKKKLASEAFGGKKAKDQREVGYEDIRTLMSL